MRRPDPKNNYCEYIQGTLGLRGFTGFANVTSPWKRDMDIIQPFYMRGHV